MRCTKSLGLVTAISLSSLALAQGVKPKPGSPASKSARIAQKAPAATAASKALPALLQEVEAKYAKAETLEAKFLQATFNATLGTKKNSSGILMVKRPDKVRWETLTPDKNLLVSDGHTFWFFTPPFDETEKGQVVERKSADVQSKMAQALLSGSFSAARDMKVAQVGPDEFTLTPKAGTSGTVQKATITIDPAQKLIKKVRLEHRDGNKAEITLSDIELGKQIDPRFFRFDPPPGTDVIRQ